MWYGYVVVGYLLSAWLAALITGCVIDAEFERELMAVIAIFWPIASLAVMVVFFAKGLSWFVSSVERVLPQWMGVTVKILFTPWDVGPMFKRWWNNWKSEWNRIRVVSRIQREWDKRSKQGKV